MNELDFIQTVKIQGQGYLLNGTINIPKVDGNREYELIKQWLEDGNTPIPEFTEEELVQQELVKNIQDALALLSKTDKKVLPDYEFREDDNTLEWYIEERKKARAFIRGNS